MLVLGIAKSEVIEDKERSNRRGWQRGAPRRGNEMVLQIDAAHALVT
jgi:hypothetical protein